MAHSKQLANGLFPVFAVIERALVHVHAHEAVCQLRVKIAGKLHGILESRFAMIQRVLDAVAQRLGNGEHASSPGCDESRCRPAAREARSVPATTGRDR